MSSKMKCEKKSLKCELKEKPAKCKIATSTPLKTKYPSTVEDNRVGGNDFNSRKVGNTKNVLPSSKVPVRSNSIASGQSPCSGTALANKSKTKNKCFTKNNKVENGTFLCKAGNLNSNLPKKKLCSMKANTIHQHNTIVESFKPHFPDKDKNNLHAKHTIQPKKMGSNKGILRKHCHNSGPLKNASDSDINFDSKVKISKKDIISNTRKVTFKTSSSNNLSKLSDDDVNLIVVTDKEKTACKTYKNNIFSPEDNYKAGDKQIFDECFAENHSKELISFSSSYDIKDDKVMSTSENTYNDSLQKENMKFLNSRVIDTSLKTETLNSGEVTNSSKNIYPCEKKCEMLPSETVTSKEILLPGDETCNEKKLERRQSIQKQIDEKVEILTAEFLKYFKENKKGKRSLGTSNKAKLKNVSWECSMSQDLCTRDESSLQDIEMNMKSITDKNEKNCNREVISHNLPLNGEVREENTLIKNVEQGLLDSHPLTEVHLDLKISPISSRIPQSTTSKKKSLKPVISLDPDTDNNMQEKRIALSPSVGQKLREAENNKMKYSPNQNLSKVEMNKTVLLRKEFDSITNVCKSKFPEEVQLKNNKTAYPHVNFKKSNSENLLSGEDFENSHHIHSAEIYNDKDVLKKTNKGAKSKKDTNYITKFKNQSAESEEELEENFCHVPSNNIISLEGDKENRPKTYLPFENKTHSSYSSGEESGNENILQYEDKENIKYDSSLKVLFSQHKKKIACFTLIFVFSTLLFITVFL